MFIDKPTTSSLVVEHSSLWFSFLAYSKALALQPSLLRFVKVLFLTVDRLMKEPRRVIVWCSLTSWYAYLLLTSVLN
jgi:hypothetical protein